MRAALTVCCLFTVYSQCVSSSLRPYYTHYIAAIARSGAATRCIVATCNQILQLSEQSQYNTVASNSPAEPYTLHSDPEVI